MSLQKTKKLDAKELRKFGLTMAIAFPVLFFLFFPWLLHKTRPMWPLYLASPFLVLGLVYPLALKPIHIVWFKIAEILGWINTRIILSILFFGIFTPLGQLRKIFSSKKKIVGETPSYRVVNDAPPSSLERPY